jgi:hypothetical protein
MNAFDGVVTMIGLLVGAWVSGIEDPKTVLLTGLATALAMATSGYAGEGETPVGPRCRPFGPARARFEPPRAALAARRRITSRPPAQRSSPPAHSRVPTCALFEPPAQLPGPTCATSRAHPRTALKPTCDCPPPPAQAPEPYVFSHMPGVRRRQRCVTSPRAHPQEPAGPRDTAASPCYAFLTP